MPTRCVRFARFRLNLSQGAAAHLIDGAGGNFSGRLVSVPPGRLGPRRGVTNRMRRR
jgi:hypothetical protein